MSPLFDTKSVESAKTGDAIAFTELVEGHYTLVYGLAFSTLRDRSAAEDITQETFLVAWTNLKKLRDAGAFSMWIRKITRNLCLNWLRSASYRRELAEHERQSSNLDGDPELHVLRDERRSKVNEALGSLSPKIREAIVLYYLEDRSVVDGAEALGITEVAMKLRLHHGRQKLRKYFLTRWESDLKDDLTAPPSQAAVRRIASGLAIGPAVPQVGQAVSNCGPSLWIHQLYHGGPNAAVKLGIKGGIIMSGKKVGIGLAVMLVLGIGGFIGYRQFDSLRSETAEETIPRVDYALLVDRDGSKPGDEAGSAEPERASEDGKSTTYETAALDLLSPDEEGMEAELAGETALEEERDDSGEIEDPKDYATVSGLVLDQKGNGIAGALVLVAASGKSERGGALPDLGDMLDYQDRIRHPGHHFSATSGPDGFFMVEGIRYEGRALVSASAFGYTFESRSGPPTVLIHPGDFVDDVYVVLKAGISLSGRVLSATSEPVSDAVVSSIGFTTGRSTSGRMTEIAHSDEDGYFHLSFRATGTTSIQVRSRVHGTSTFTNVPVTAGGKVELKMYDPATVSGTLQWSDGSAAEGVEVVLEGHWYDSAKSGEKPLGFGTVSSAFTSESGGYRFAEMDPGQLYTIAVHDSDSRPLTSHMDFGFLEPGEERTWDYTIQDVIVVRGVVYGESTGKPLPRVKVSYLRDGMKQAEMTVPVEPDGSYELHILSGPGTYTIYPQYWRLDPVEEGWSIGQTVDLKAGDETRLDLHLRDTFRMAFQVVNLAGEPLEGLMLGVRDDSHTWSPAGFTDREGRWEWDGFISGISTGVVVRGNDRRRIRSTEYVGAPGEIVAEEVLVLQEYGGIEGVALTADGEPIGKTPIRISATPVSGEGAVSFSTLTDEDGSFVLADGIPATQVTIEIEVNVTREGGNDTFRWESQSFVCPADMIVNLGTIPFGTTPPRILPEDFKTARR